MTPIFYRLLPTTLRVTKIQYGLVRLKPRIHDPPPSLRSYIGNFSEKENILRRWKTNPEDSKLDMN